MYKLNHPIPHVARFRYFEVDVIENKLDCTIYLGIIEDKDPFHNELDNLTSMTGQQTLIINGLDGTSYFGALGKPINKSLTMKEFGDSVGVCIHY